MSTGKRTGYDPDARCSCGSKHDCCGHFALRQSYYDNGAFPVTDTRVSKGNPNGLEIGDARDPHRRYR